MTAWLAFQLAGGAGWVTVDEDFPEQLLDGTMEPLSASGSDAGDALPLPGMAQVAG